MIVRVSVLLWLDDLTLEINFKLKDSWEQYI